MLDCAEVEAMIRNVIEADRVHVEGDGHHFFVHIVSAAFEGKTRLQRHRLVKDGLAHHIHDNTLHALSIASAATPAEWAARKR